MNLTQSIQELLYQHECVVIPQFGGFVTNYKAAFVHPKKRTVHPPSKQLSFNVNLVNNDGLLANYISQAEGVSYEVALNYVQSAVSDFSENLKNKNRLELEGIGILSKNSQGTVEFSPDNTTNFLRNSFGLKPVFLPSLGELLGEETEEEVLEETPVVPLTAETKEEITPVIPIQTKRKKRGGLLAAAIILPLMFLGGFTAHQNQDQLASFFSGFFPTSSNLQAQYTPRIEGEKVVFNYESIPNEIETIAEQNPELQSFYYSFEKGEISPDGVKVVLDSPITADVKVESAKVSPSTIKPPTDIQTQSASSSSVSSSKLGLYFPVAGAFAEKPNADKLVAKLKAKGYDAAIFTKSGSLHMVCYGSYTNKSAAKSALLKIQNTVNPDAWLKKH